MATQVAFVRTILLVTSLPVSILRTIDCELPVRCSKDIKIQVSKIKENLSIDKMNLLNFMIKRDLSIELGV